VRFQKGSKINVGRKKSKEEIDRRTKTRQKNGFFKDLEKRKRISKQVYDRTLKCPICNCLMSKNKKHSCREIWDKINTKFQKGELHKYFDNWKSLEPYGKDFNKELKKNIRKRDNFRCQECFKHEKESKRRLSIHHIDYDKNNSKPDNLICLCVSCHAKTNYTKEKWENYFIKRRGGKC